MKLVRDRRVAYKNIDGTAYAVSPWDHKLHKLNETGTFICALIEKNLSKNEIAKRVVGEYDISSSQAERDYRDFLEKLVHKGLYHKKK